MMYLISELNNTDRQYKQFKKPKWILPNGGQKMEENHVHGPDCSHEDEFTTEELVYAANDKVDVLVDLLIKKGVITESEYEDELTKYYKEIEEESDLEEE